jgi:c-di-GMP-binding flagellar brake protein YcgR
MNSAARRYIRHTINVPLEVTASGTMQNAAELSVNLSHGGLAFASEECLAAGSLIELRIPTVDPPFDAKARVVWCRPENSKYLVGVEFLDKADAFRSRMVEQVCTIEEYRQQVRRAEGRTLSSQEAAEEWIVKYAGAFPHAEPE